MSRVVPAILTESPRNLGKMVRQAETFTDYVQFDIMDGQFVPSYSINWKDIAGISPRMKWEAHLMVRAPKNYLDGFRSAGADKIVFHCEATDSPHQVILEARRLGLKAGLAISPETPVSAILPLSNEIDSLLLLSVHPGFYGSRFIPEVLNKVGEFRKAQPDKEIGIDGGIKENNINQVARTGVDVIYVGSAIFLQPDPAQSYRRLTDLANIS